MDEARRVRERLNRIDALRAEGAGARAILAELDALIAEVRGRDGDDAHAGAHGGLCDVRDRDVTPKGMIAM